MWGIPKWARWVAVGIAIVAVAVVVVAAAAVLAPVLIAGATISLSIAAGVAVGAVAGAVAIGAASVALRGKIDKATLGYAAGGAVLGALAVAATSIIGAATAGCSMSTGCQSAYQKGISGLQQAGVQQNTQRIIAPSGNGRIPDLLSTSGDKIMRIGEVKNTASLSLTSQLRDYVGISQQTPGLRLELFVRDTTVISAPLQAEIDSGNIILNRVITNY
jgi:hypothetical protein